VANAICSQEGCERPNHGRGLCRKHYRDFWRNNQYRPRCESTGCDSPADARGLCKAHGNQRRREAQAGQSCVVTGCGRTISARGLCWSHYTKARPGTALVIYTGVVEPPRRRLPKPNVNPIRQTPRKFKGCNCIVCGAAFLTLYMDMTCSQECQDIHAKEMKRVHKDRRRARQREAYVEDVYRQRVFDLDAYRCHLCKSKCDPSKAVPHPKAPTLDHVIPLAAGGKHEPKNCRTACYSCNNSKGDRGGGEQLALLG